MTRKLQTDDIAGAQPKRAFAYTRGACAPAHVEGSRPQAAYHARFSNKPDSFLVQDIEGAQPKTNMFRTRRSVNPLNPVYKLPSHEALPFEPLRFLRDSIDVSDIDGARARPAPQSEPRNSHDVGDIEGAHASWRSHKRAALERMRSVGVKKADSLEVSDITDKGFKSRRCVDPLNPVYKHHGEDIYDSPRGTAPKPRKTARNANVPFYSLHTADIAGAQGDSGSVFATMKGHRRTEFRAPNNVADIPGAKPGSLRRGLRSKRQTNPLQPRYRFLHGSDTPTPPDDSAFEKMRNTDKWALNQRDRTSTRKTPDNASSRPASASSASSASSQSAATKRFSQSGGGASGTSGDGGSNHDSGRGSGRRGSGGGSGRSRESRSGGERKTSDNNAQDPWRRLPTSTESARDDPLATARSAPGSSGHRPSSGGRSAARSARGQAPASARGRAPSRGSVQGRLMVARAEDITSVRDLPDIPT